VLRDHEARVLLDRLLNLRITDVDTARGYASEERLGRSLQGRRESVVRFTRVGYDVPGRGLVRRSVRDGVRGRGRSAACLS
jgi:aryl-alcohol dehydrogenase-like predicted oxidoreductase